jgi:serine protease Do
LAKPLLGGHTSAARAGTATVPSRGMGLSFPKHRAAKTALPPSKVFAVAATRTVLIKTDQGTGSGVCITDNGHVLTCSHVIPTRTSSIDVTMFKYVAGRAIKAGESGADLIYRDEASDIAVLKVRRPTATLKALSLSRDAVTTGQRVYALGSPGLGDKVLAQSLSAGLVSAASRQVDGRSWIQHTAVINPGNSGGPLLSERGEILGIATLKATIDGVGFAVPSSKIRKLIGAP